MEDESGYYATDMEGEREYIRASARGYEFMKQIYETYSGFAKNTKTFETSFENRIPDFVNKAALARLKMSNIYISLHKLEVLWKLQQIRKKICFSR